MEKEFQPEIQMLRAIQMLFGATELENAIHQIQQTIGILRRNSCDCWVAALERLLADVRSDALFAQKQALFKIGELCDPRALGDVQLGRVDGATWDAQLETLHDTCATAYNILEKPIT